MIPMCIRSYSVQMLFLEYFCANDIPPILLKYLDWGMMSVHILVYLSLTYRQNEILKIRFWLGDH